MPVLHITKIEVDKLEYVAQGRIDYFDDRLKGFGVRVSAKQKTYFAMRRVDGQLVRTRIDTADKITATEARRKAERLLADMGQGQNPNEAKREARKRAAEERKKGLTLQEALDQYLNKGKLKPRTLTTCRGLFQLYLSDWLERPAQEITRDMVRSRHREIAAGQRQRQRFSRKGSDPPEAIEQRREAAADNCMRALRTVLNYCFEDEESGTPYLNPVNVLSSKRQKAWFKVDRRRTLIKNSDLPAWYRGVMGLEHTVARDYFIFLLFTGLRRREAATLQWRQVDFNERCFTVVDTKNGDPHTLPLSDHLWKLLYDRKEGLAAELAAAKSALLSTKKRTQKQRQAAANRLALAESRLESPYVFPGETKAGCIENVKRPIEQIRVTTGVTFSPHDLRRTFATVAESLDLSGYTIKALLNHRQQLSDVTGGYIILGVDRLRAPMQRITDTLLERTKLTTKPQPAKVVPLRSAGGAGKK